MLVHITWWKLVPISLRWCPTGHMYYDPPEGMYLKSTITRVVQPRTPENKGARYQRTKDAQRTHSGAARRMSQASAGCAAALVRPIPRIQFTHYDKDACSTCVHIISIAARSRIAVQVAKSPKCRI